MKILLASTVAFCLGAVIAAYLVHHYDLEHPPVKSGVDFSLRVDPVTQKVDLVTQADDVVHWVDEKGDPLKHTIFYKGYPDTPCNPADFSVTPPSTTPTLTDGICRVNADKAGSYLYGCDINSHYTCPDPDHPVRGGYGMEHLRKFDPHVSKCPVGTLQPVQIDSSGDAEEATMPYRSCVIWDETVTDTVKYITSVTTDQGTNACTDNQNDLSTRYPMVDSASHTTACILQTPPSAKGTYLVKYQIVMSNSSVKSATLTVTSP